MLNDQEYTTVASTVRFTSDGKRKHKAFYFRDPASVAIAFDVAAIDATCAGELAPEVLGKRVRRLAETIRDHGGVIGVLSQVQPMREEEARVELRVASCSICLLEVPRRVVDGATAARGIALAVANALS